VLSRRVALAAAGAALFGAGAWLAGGPPRLTLLNASLRLHHPWTQAAGALVAAGGAGLAAAMVRRRALRVAAGLVAAGALVAGARLIAYRVELSDDALVAASLLQRSEIPWDAIARVEIAPGALLVFEREQLVLRLDTAGLSGDQKATLERGISRRVREAYELPGS